MRTERFHITPFWKVTRWGFAWEFLRPTFGADEHHNKSLQVIIPLVGCFVWFFTTDRTGPEHLYGFSNGVPQGRIVPGCNICELLLKEW